MKKVLLSVALIASFSFAKAQAVFDDHFNSNTTSFATSNAEFTIAHDPSALKITTAGHDEWSYVTLAINNGTSATTVDITGKQKLFIRAKASSDVLLRVTLIDDANKETGNDALKPEFQFALTTEYQVFEIDYTGNLTNVWNSQGALDQTKIAKIGLKTNPGFASYPETVGAKTYNAAFNGTVYVDYISLGDTTALVAGMKNFNIASSNLFPNPATENANIDLSLENVADVKVTLTDLMGREIQVISETRGTEVKESFNVANLQKGLYTVNYFVDGAPAKAELLMVK